MFEQLKEGQTIVNKNTREMGVIEEVKETTYMVRVSSEVNSETLVEMNKVDCHPVRNERSEA